ncbi:hypothetical protein FQA47_005104 [Oryzias melastigma]|uniref:Uncharacterized protein n=1 Tax=Oryzias melastigma TaxID=30732 RepID=A0A834CKS1_ORYME|nr:hypothetical protein FQA47_005104 [Oryzias melastigma]
MLRGLRCSSEGSRRRRRRRRVDVAAMGTGKGEIASQNQGTCAPFVGKCQIVVNLSAAINSVLLLGPAGHRKTSGDERCQRSQ